MDEKAQEEVEPSKMVQLGINGVL
jgi:hypothetical protein